MNRLRNPFNVTSATQVAGIAALADTDFVAMSLAHNTQCRTWFSEALTGLGLTVVPSVTNFVLVRFPGQDGKTASAAWDYLKANGILTRKVAAYGFPDGLRVTIGQEDEMRIVTETIATFLKK